MDGRGLRHIFTELVVEEGLDVCASRAGCPRREHLEGDYLECRLSRHGCCGYESSGGSSQCVSQRVASNGASELRRPPGERPAAPVGLVGWLAGRAVVLLRVAAARAIRSSVPHSPTGLVPGLERRGQQGPHRQRATSWSSPGSFSCPLSSRLEDLVTTVHEHLNRPTPEPVAGPVYDEPT